MLYKVTEPFLWLPVKKDNSSVKLYVYTGEDLIHEIDLCLSDGDLDFYAFLDVTDYIDRVIEVKSEVPEELLNAILNRSEKPIYNYPKRPKLHFAPDHGWLNDPNGLCYSDGQYHLYYQYNPYGVAWGNMHWGHAVSKDLILWEELDIALFPDEKGTVYSGCAVIDEKNLLGYGKDTLLFYYTAAGGINEWSKTKGNLFTQRLAYSTDGGKTLHKSDKFFMEHIVDENRDPKIFYHEPTHAYVMIMYLSKNDFVLYRSEDLVNWEQTQEISGKGMWECPDLMELKVDDNPESTKWVFFSADGFYIVGDFDGFKFTAESNVNNAYVTPLPYAAQTYFGTDNTISIPWLRMKNTNGNYCGLMGLPMVISLGNKDNKLKMKFSTVKQYKELERKEILVLDNEHIISLDHKPVELIVGFTEHISDIVKIKIGKTQFIFDFTNGELMVEEYRIPITKKTEFTFIVDQEVIEFLGDSGFVYGSIETEEDLLSQKIVIEADMNLLYKKCYELQV